MVGKLGRLGRVQFPPCHLPYLAYFPRLRPLSLSADRKEATVDEIKSKIKNLDDKSLAYLAGYVDGRTVTTAPKQEAEDEKNEEHEKRDR